jgi:DNA-binding NarL/FixJ family response regulator
MTAKPKASPGTKRKIFLVDDHPVLRDGLRRLLEAEPDLQVCGEAENARKAVDRIEATTPELAIIDISLPGPSGIELLKNLKVRFPELRMLVVSMHDEARSSCDSRCRMGKITFSRPLETSGFCLE